MLIGENVISSGLNATELAVGTECDWVRAVVTRTEWGLIFSSQQLVHLCIKQFMIIHLLPIHGGGGGGGGDEGDLKLGRERNATEQTLPLGHMVDHVVTHGCCTCTTHTN